MNYIIKISFILIVNIIFTGCFGTFYGSKVNYIDPTGKEVTYIEKKKDFDFINAVASGDYKTVKYLISYENANRFYTNSISTNAIWDLTDVYISLANKFIEMVDNDKSIERYPLIVVASKYGYEDIVTLLLQYKANPNAWITNTTDKKVFTNAISEAYFHKHYKIVNILMNHNAKTDVYCLKWKTTVKKELLLKYKNNTLTDLEKTLFNFSKK